MAQQKLYTEEQVKQVWKSGQKYWETSGASITLEELLEKLTPIELPSDEEIYDISQLIKENVKIVPFHSVSFQYGAKWMRDKILNK